MSSDVVSIDKPAKERETWSGKFDFFLTSLGYAVGLGAIWRFPTLCYKNGGGAFLVPYFFFLFLIGIPMVFLEMSVGQFTSSGPMNSWVMTPILKGIGFSVNTVNNYVNIYFTMILAYSLYFLVLSFNTVLPWEKCNPNWKQKNCVDTSNRLLFNFTECADYYLRCNNGVCYNQTNIFGTKADCSQDVNSLEMVGYWKRSYPSEIFWKEIVLQKSPGIEHTGHIVWQLLVGLIVSWLIIFAMVIKGIKVSGKLVYFTSLFPYFVLLLLGIRGWLLEGAAKGIKFYIYPDFSKLKNLSIWSDAASQIFFTLSVSYGGISALSSYNNFKTNILRDSIMVSLANCGTSVFSGFVVFSYIGYLSEVTGQSIDKVVQEGQGLAFVVYPFAVTTIKGAPFWSVMFFFMMLILGLDSSMASVETFITSVFDLFPKLREKNWKRYLSIAIICGTYFVCGIIFCFQSGTYWIDIFNTFSGNWAIFILAALESVSVGWFYGYRNFRKDLSTMLGSKITDHFLFNIFGILWAFVTPVIVLGLMVLALIGFNGLQDGDYKYPYWTTIVGIIVSSSTLYGVVLYAIYFSIKKFIIEKKSIKIIFKPDETWRPLKKENRLLVDIAHNRTESQLMKAYDNKNFDYFQKF